MSAENLRFHFYHNCYYEKVGNNTPVKLEDLPFDIPENWMWIRLYNTSSLIGGYAFKSDKFLTNGVRIIRISDFDESGIKNKDIKRYPYSDELDQYQLFNNDIIMCMTGGTVGKSLLVKFLSENSYINQRIALIRNLHVNVQYLYLIIQSHYIKNIINGNKTSTNDNISMPLIGNFLLPIPPLNEQQRIVEKIDFLSPYINEYEKLESELYELDSTIKDKLKKSILQYAIEGKLVKQDPNDEPASVLLERIKAEKEKLIKEGKIKRDKNESYIYQGDDKNYYENLPASWEKTYLVNVVLFAKRGKSPTYTTNEDGVLVIAQKCNQWDGLHLEKALKTPKSTLPKYTWDRISYPFDIIINSTGGGTVGRTGYLNREIFNENPILVPDSHITTIRTGEYMCSKFIYYFFISSQFQNNVEEYCEGSTNQIELYSKVILGLAFPLPPLKEQYRIVNQLDYLFGKIDNQVG